MGPIGALEEHDSSQIDPCAAGKSPQFELPPASIAGLDSGTGLEARQAAKAGLHQVLARGVRIVADAAAKQIVGVQRWDLVLHPDKAERLAGEEVVVALLD